MWNRGYIQVYTGNGKGKTTAALGLALRAAGKGLKTYIGQFMKGQDYGELEAARRLAPFITIEQFGKQTFVHIDRPTEEDVALATEGLRRVSQAINSGQFQIVVMDEINIALHLKLLELDQVLRLLDNKPEQVELVLTGRHAPQAIIDRAHLVTEMQEVKHYFQQGISAREGIEK
ncbi:MAG: cob(I)yrinic acid a,c-diamide adenosyltransferase [candidate division KSB1 bacterium]|nr:cob(I)yrinic acid a,c-diamide adenosyltransferase [candidate division KSB1 bacterium]